MSISQAARATGLSRATLYCHYLAGSAGSGTD